MKARLKWLFKETGEVFIIVLVLLVVGALTLVPLLSYMGTGLKSGTVYENQANDFYAADSGIEDGLWQMKNDHIQVLIPTYDIYGFDKPTTDYPSGQQYAYPAPLNVNSRTVDVTIDNVWMPATISGGSVVSLAPADIEPFGLSLTDLHNIVADARLVVAGSSNTPTTFSIAFSYNSQIIDPTLYVSQIGIWMPPGFTYDTALKSSFENNPQAQYRPSSTTVSDYNGGTVVIWDWSSPILFLNLPGMTQSGNNVKVNVSVNFTAQPGAPPNPNMVPWIYTKNSFTDLRFAWDADVRVFKVNSVSSGGTEIDAYGVKLEQRTLAKTIAGDYQAIGNSLMIDSNGDGYYRETLLTESTSTESVIPSDAEVAAAYLYWSGWKTGNAGTPSDTPVAPLNPDTASNFNNWILLNSAWSSDGNRFVGHYDSGGEPARYLTLTSSLDLSAYANPNVTVSWEQTETGTLESPDALYFSFSNNGGNTWSDGGVGTNGFLAFNDDNPSSPFSYTIPSLYLTNNFKMRFYLSSFAEPGEYCYVDNIAVKVQVLNDTCSNFSNWTAGSAWDIDAGRFRGWTYNKSSPGRYLSMNSSLNLSTWVGKTVTVSWEQTETGTLESSDALYFSFSNNGGSTWSDGGVGTNGFLAFNDDNPTLNFGPYTIPQSYLTSGFRMRFYVGSFTESGEYCYIDNIVINAIPFSDNCSNLDNWTLIGGAWGIFGNAFRGRYTGADDAARYLTLASSMDLSTYTTEIVTASWEQWGSAPLASTDALQFQFSSNGGTTWGDVYTAAQDDVQAGGLSNTTKTFGFRIPSQYLTNSFKVRFYLAGFGSGTYCYIDNITVSHSPVIFDDRASYAPPNALTNWTSDGDWTSYYNSEFVGTYASGNRYLRMTSSLNLSAYTGHSLVVTWKQRETGTLASTDALKFQFSDDGGSSWSPVVYTAFTDDNPSSPFSYTIPSEYVTSNFKMRFYLDGFGSGKACFIDDIKIYDTGLGADTAAYLKINGHQVSFNAITGLPQKDIALDLQADRAYVDPNTLGGYSFACVKDVTALIRAFGTKGPNNNYPGNDPYTVGGVNATPAANQSENQYQLAYAGWSLVIIYTSQATLGHQLYLYDTSFMHNDGNSNLDFDQDGQPGGTITGFLVPEQITGETIAARITCFIGEGDDLYTGDNIALNGTRLWDGITTTGNSSVSPLNVWNGKSTGLTAAGVDVDTFNITWASNILLAGDNVAQVDLDTDTDQWNLVYIIISFRSLTSTGGAITYLIRSS